ncbi:hypothetical protein JRO89_XS03G0134100 [Xanthoceras sorbifolium]|uniref:Uncharacterized protein n=1 Tax=Xanthoceras sorbifolium TaxID=99658 RepID=A0ABQ8I9R3_9ROSI|nr:hypothetical protein JRO89_XS03G0134100 [Xanthoceras sorbifolium]
MEEASSSSIAGVELASPAPELVPPVTTSSPPAIINADSCHHRIAIPRFTFIMISSFVLNHVAHSDTTVAMMLVGNKCDLESIRAVSIDEGKSLAEEEGLFFMETSALDSTNVKKAFEIVIREIYNNVSRKVLNSDTYKAELSLNRVTLAKSENDGSKKTQNYFSCCSS